MVDPEKPEKDKDPFLEKIKNYANFHSGLNYLRTWLAQISAGALMFIGIVLAFFYVQTGGFLVGLGFGICFFEEIYTYFFQLRNLYTEQGLFKTLMIIGTILYFLIAIPAFIIAAAIGFGVVFLIRWLLINR